VIAAPVRPPGTLVFDLDGTLVDTAGDLTVTLNAVLAGEGLAAVPPDRARAMIGHGARAMLEAGLKASGADPSPARIDALFARFIAHYGENIAAHSRPYPGAEAALDRLSAAGWRLAVCTNKLEALSRRLLEALGLAGRFAAIAGQDTFGVRKPDPRHLTGTLLRVGGAGRPAVMVGDSDVDLATAGGAGVPAIAVTFGYGPLTVTNLPPAQVIDDFDGLDAAIAALTAD
jgi:phosphoglycolate phosphatase